MLLYKYMSLDAALAVLESGTIGFSRPSFLNDPFDTPVAEVEVGTAAIAAVFNKVRADVKSRAWERNSAVLSLTRTASNPLMWAHYADHHRGVVMAIDTVVAGLNELGSNMIPAHFGNVVYARQRPRGPYHSTFEKGVLVGGTFHFEITHYEKWQRMFLTKPLEWAYEEEVRVVKCINGLDEGKSCNDSGDFRIVDIGRPLHCFRLQSGSIVA